MAMVHNLSSVSLHRLNVSNPANNRTQTTSAKRLLVAREPPERLQPRAQEQIIMQDIEPLPPAPNRRLALVRQSTRLRGRPHRDAQRQLQPRTQDMSHTESPRPIRDHYSWGHALRRVLDQLSIWHHRSTNRQKEQYECLHGHR